MYAWSIPELSWLETRASCAFPRSVLSSFLGQSPWRLRVAPFVDVMSVRHRAGGAAGIPRTRCTDGAGVTSSAARPLIFQLFHQFLLQDSIWIFGLFETIETCIIFIFWIFDLYLICWFIWFHLYLMYLMYLYILYIWYICGICGSLYLLYFLWLVYCI